MFECDSFRCGYVVSLLVCVLSEPNTPGKFIVWFRNETTLLVLWQPPYPPGAYTHYKVCTTPTCIRLRLALPHPNIIGILIFRCPAHFFL